MPSVSHNEVTSRPPGPGVPQASRIRRNIKTNFSFRFCRAGRFPLDINRQTTRHRCGYLCDSPEYEMSRSQPIVIIRFPRHRTGRFRFTPHSGVSVGSLETEIPGSGNVADVGEQCVYRARCGAILPDQSYGRMCSGHGLRRYCSCQIAPTCV